MTRPAGARRITVVIDVQKMMNSSNDNPTPDLLGYHLGLDDDLRLAALEAEFGGSEGLTRSCARLQALLSNLDHDAAEPPTDLSARVLDAVAAARNTIPFDPAARPLPVEADARRGGAALLTLREVVGLAAAVLVFVSIFVPGYRTARSAAQRTACMNNVRNLGTGYASYAATNGGYLPYVGAAVPGAAWVRTDEIGVPRMSNAQHVFQLLSNGFAQPEDFVCPSRPGDYPLDSDDYTLFQDFADPRNSSYSTNFVRGPVRTATAQPGMALLADKNPLAANKSLI